MSGFLYKNFQVARIVPPRAPKVNLFKVWRIPKNKAACQRLCRAVEQVTGWKLRGEDGYKPDNAGQHSRLAYAQAGGIIFEPFFISNDADLAQWKQTKWSICRAIANAIAEEVKA